MYGSSEGMPACMLLSLAQAASLYKKRRRGRRVSVAKKDGCADHLFFEALKRQEHGKKIQQARNIVHRDRR